MIRRQQNYAVAVRHYDGSIYTVYSTTVKGAEKQARRVSKWADVIAITEVATGANVNYRLVVRA